MVMRIGMIGFSEGNGHPYSFSAIVNGYDRTAFRSSKWEVIANYLDLRAEADFGFDGIEVTHAWSECEASTSQHCKSCHIGVACNDLSDMFGEVDAVIIARDDWEIHHELAIPFLERGCYVFVDKPLTLNEAQLTDFSSFLYEKKLMSCSGFRFSTEISLIKNILKDIGPIRTITGTVVNDLQKYGIHLVDAINGAGIDLGPPTEVTRLPSGASTFNILYENGTNFLLNCLGNSAKVFHLSFFGQSGVAHVDLEDNFGAFKATLKSFFDLSANKQAIPASETIETMSLLRTLKNLNVGQCQRLHKLKG